MNGSSSRQRISLPVFFILLFIVSWIGTIPMLSASWKSPKQVASFAWLQFLMLFGPGLVAVTVKGLNEGKKGIRELLGGLLKWRVDFFWYFIALFGPAITILLARELSKLFGVALPPLQNPENLAMVFLSTFLVYLVLNTEEIAWRGYGLPELQSIHGPLKASFILGLLWGIFHLPIFLLKGGHPAGYPFSLYLIMVLAMTFVFTWMFNGTGRSLLLVHLLHQSLNAWAEAIPYYPKACKSYVPFVMTLTLFCLAAVVVSITKLRNARY
jgi:membrane protease YdiL (CAAX protease family)